MSDTCVSITSSVIFLHLLGGRRFCSKIGFYTLLFINADRKSHFLVSIISPMRQLPLRRECTSHIKHIIVGGKPTCNNNPCSTATSFGKCMGRHRRGPRRSVFVLPSQWKKLFIFLQQV